MSWLEGIRRRQVTTARAITALFALAWLGLAVQPCTAMTVEPAAEHSGMAGHHAAGDGGHDCPHCPPSSDAADDCGAALGCDAVGVPALPGKGLDLPGPDLSAVLPSDAIPRPLAGRWGVPTPAFDRSCRRSPPVSLQRVYCTYLK